MNDFSIRYKLEQHTPMIHFQAKQSGATLRATELKPKLDKFLLKKKIEKLPMREHPNGDRSLPYKVTITATEVESKLINTPNQKGKYDPFPAYFANLGEKDPSNHKLFSMAKNIEITFFSLYPEVIDAIRTYFAEFLLKHNFGTRQTKGFGSFYIDPADNNYVKPETLYKGVYHFNTPYKDAKNLFEDVDLFYRSLRSGINMKNSSGTVYYFKSAMFLFTKNVLNAVWDKRAIKQKFLNPSKLSEQIADHNGADILTDTPSKDRPAYLMRDLLGLSTQQSWMSEKFTLTKEHSEISRMKSPILFKPLKTDKGFRVHLVLYAMPEKIFNEEFSITTDKSREKLLLPTPPTTLRDKIKTGAFVQYAINTIDVDKHVSSDYHQYVYHDKLKRIYSDLKRSLGGKK
ncbi:MAG: hypothetical protein AB7S65_11365 [Sulfuricurvum sp.]